MGKQKRAKSQAHPSWENKDNKVSKTQEAQTSAEGSRDSGPPDLFSQGLVEVRPAEGKGDGVFTLTTIADNSFVGLYTGEVLTHEEYLERYPQEDAEYVMQASCDSYHCLLACPSCPSCPAAGEP